MNHHENHILELPGATQSPVAVMKASSYSQNLVRPILDGLRACGIDVRGKSVLLKPNLVEFDRAAAVNTDASVVAAAFEAFHQAGAAAVRIGEGPGHRRDTFDLAREAQYRLSVPDFDGVFTDLNRDDVSPVNHLASQAPFYLPDTALGADYIVSLAKMKTHHWAGVTLSMKNLFGLVPGAIYGWPKNVLHYVGITQSILELNRIFTNTIAIVDGIVGMEGNGPVHGTSKAAGVLVVGRDLRAVDATCCRIMGINPVEVEHLKLSAARGRIEEHRIEQRGETPAAVRTPFALIHQFSGLRA